MNRRVSATSLLLDCYASAIAAVQPDLAMRAPLGQLTPADAPCWILSAGKASHGMARAIVGWLAAHGREPAGGIVVSTEVGPAPYPSLVAIQGDHPIPGAQSARAGAAMAETIRRIPANAEVHVALSGGASALMATPLDGVSIDAMTRTFALLLRSGLDIDAMNAVRKRVTRWSAGRLALALAPRVPIVWLISDVPGDHPASIASGPCSGDRWQSAVVRDLLEKRGLLVDLPASVRAALTHETPKPGDAVFAAIAPRIVASNATALIAAAAHARRAGIAAQIMVAPLEGEASSMAQAIATTAAQSAGEPTVRVWGGETTVTISASSGRGGRSQELALAAAQQMKGCPEVLLAAGTDGRDGPTDAAGAMVTGDTWSRVVSRGRDPAHDLATHDAYAALDAADALIRTGPTGTNVMDLVLTASGWP